jgi:hypothetical protein
VDWWCVTAGGWPSRLGGCVLKRFGRGRVHYCVSCLLGCTPSFTRWILSIGNRVRMIACQTHTHLPYGWGFCPIFITIGTIFVTYPNPNREISHGLAGIRSPLTSLSLMICSPHLTIILRGASSMCLVWGQSRIRQGYSWFGGMGHL